MSATRVKDGRLLTKAEMLAEDIAEKLRERILELAEEKAKSERSNFISDQHVIHSAYDVFFGHELGPELNDLIID